MDEDRVANTDQLTRRLVAAGRTKLSVSVDASTEAVARVLEDPEMRADLNARRRRLTPRAKAVMTLLVASLVTGVGVAAPAIALATFAAQTGRFVDPSTSTEEDSTEWLDLSASDLPDAVAAAYPAGLQLPPGVDASEAVRKVQSIFGRFAAGTAKHSTSRACHDHL